MSKYPVKMSCVAYEGGTYEYNSVTMQLKEV